MKHRVIVLLSALAVCLLSSCVLEDGQEPQWLEDAPEESPQASSADGVPALLPDYGGNHSGEHSGEHH